MTGVLTFSGLLITFTTAVILAPEQGWGSPVIHALLCASAVFLLLFISAPMLIVPIIAASLTRWLSAGVLCAIGFVIAAAGRYWLSTIPIGTHAQIIAAMLLTGIGTGLPWGLMDGLSISVIPKERAGMAAGIFNTTRVASEGVALAITVAVLTALVAHHLSISASVKLSAVDYSTIAQRLVMGDIQHASTDASQIPLTILRSAYTAGFNTLLQLLAMFTLFTAAVVFLFLGRRQSEVGAESAPDVVRFSSDT